MLWSIILVYSFSTAARADDHRAEKTIALYSNDRRLLLMAEMVGGSPAMESTVDFSLGRQSRFPGKFAWQFYPMAMTAAGLAVLVQFGLIAGLIINRVRRKRVETALIQSEDRYRQVVESQTEMVCRYKPDATLTFVNEAYCRFFGRSREELLGLKFYDFIPKEIHPEIEATLQRLVQEKQRISNEHPVTNPDGTTSWFLWEDHPIFNEKGEIAELQGIGRDITKRWLALEALRQSEQRFSGIFRGSPAAICIIRQKDGILLEVNPSWEKFFEVGRDEALLSSFSDLRLLKDPKAEQRFEVFLQSGQSLRSFEQAVKTRKGKDRWMSISTELITLNHEPCLIVMSKDITEQREVEDARQSLVQATKLAMLGELTASIAHEVNQPLGAILSNADTAEILLRSEAPSIADLRKIIADIRRDDLRASEVIKRVRALIGKREIKMSVLDLNELLVDVEHLVIHDTKRRGIRIVRELAMDLPPVFGDRVQIEQIFLNLFLNAMDVFQEVAVTARRITLRSVQLDNEFVEISLRDNGPGFQAQTITRVFDSFFTTKKSGMGLGLALARSIAEAHRGRLTAENHPEGGAIFRLVLPIHSSHIP